MVIPIKFRKVKKIKKSSLLDEFNYDDVHDVAI